MVDYWNGQNGTSETQFSHISAVCATSFTRFLASFFDTIRHMNAVHNCHVPSHNPHNTDTHVLLLSCY